MKTKKKTNEQLTAEINDPIFASDVVTFADVPTYYHWNSCKSVSAVGLDDEIYDAITAKSNKSFQFAMCYLVGHHYLKEN